MLITTPNSEISSLTGRGALETMFHRYESLYREHCARMSFETNMLYHLYSCKERVGQTGHNSYVCCQAIFFVFHDFQHWSTRNGLGQSSMRCREETMNHLSNLKVQNYTLHVIDMRVMVFVTDGGGGGFVGSGLKLLGLPFQGESCGESSNIKKITYWRKINSQTFLR